MCRKMITLGRKDTVWTSDIIQLAFALGYQTLIQRNPSGKTNLTFEGNDENIESLQQALNVVSTEDNCILHDVPA